MQVITVLPEQYPRLRKRILRFVMTYRDRHITRETREKMHALVARDLHDKGNILLTAVEGKRLLGVLAATRYGQGFSLAVVNRQERSRGVGKALLRQAIAYLEEFHVEIASDNIPSLKIAFACGMLGYDVFTRENGKVILKLKYLPLKK